MGPSLEGDRCCRRDAPKAQARSAPLPEAARSDHPSEASSASQDGVANRPWRPAQSFSRAMPSLSRSSPRLYLIAARATGRSAIPGGVRRRPNRGWQPRPRRVRQPPARLGQPPGRPPRALSWSPSSARPTARDAALAGLQCLDVGHGDLVFRPGASAADPGRRRRGRRPSVDRRGRLTHAGAEREARGWVWIRRWSVIVAGAARRRWLRWRRGY